MLVGDLRGIHLIENQLKTVVEWLLFISSKLIRLLEERGDHLDATAEVHAMLVAMGLAYV